MHDYKPNKLNQNQPQTHNVTVGPQAEHTPSLRFTFRLFPGLSQFQYNFLHSSFS